MTQRKVNSRSLASFQRSRLECIYLLIFKCTELFTRKASKAWSVDRIYEESAEECSHSCLFFSAGLLKLDFNDTLVKQHTYISSEHFQLGKRRNHARPGQRKFACPGKEWNSRPSGSVVGTSDKHVVFGGSWVQFSPWVRKFSLSRASMISPPSKLKIFTGSVCVLLTSVSLKLIKIKIKLIYATTSSWEKNKMAGES